MATRIESENVDTAFEWLKTRNAQALLDAMDAGYNYLAVIARDGDTDQEKADARDAALRLGRAREQFLLQALGLPVSDEPMDGDEYRDRFQAVYAWSTQNQMPLFDATKPDSTFNPVPVSAELLEKVFVDGE